MTEKIKLSDYGYTILQIEIKSICSMKCQFCAYPLREDKGITLGDSEVFNAIDSLDSNDDRLEYLGFSQYSEPLMDERIFRFIKYAKDNNFKVQIITNALLFSSPNLRKQLLEAEPTCIKISLHTLTEDLFLKSRGISYSFGEYLKNIFDFLRLSEKGNYSSVIIVDLACNFLTKGALISRLMGLERGDPSVPDSIDEIKSGVIDFLRELKNYDPCFIFDEKDTINKLVQASNSYLDEVGVSIGRNIKIKIKPFIYGRRLTEYHPVKAVSRGCGNRVVGILSSGSVTPCCLAYEDILSMGNIKSESLQSILNRNKDFIAGIQRGTHLPEICKRCQGAPTRRGAIFLNTLKTLKNLRKPPIRQHSDN